MISSSEILYPFNCASTALTGKPFKLFKENLPEGMRNLTPGWNRYKISASDTQWRLSYIHALSGLFPRLINSGVSCRCLFYEAYTGRNFSFIMLYCHSSLQAIMRFMHGCKVTVIHEKYSSFIRMSYNVKQMTRMQ